MYDFIWTIFYEFRQAIPPALIGLVLGVMLLFILNRRRRRDGTAFPKGQAAAVLLLLCYLGGLIAITFMNRMDGMQMGFQLYPFLAFREAWNAVTLQTWLNPLLNIAMFVPLGVLLPLAGTAFRRWYWALAAGAGTSLGIEVLQYLLGRGQADVDDLICNILGTMLGYSLCLGFISLIRKQWRSVRIYAVLPTLFIAALAGVFLVYHMRPYGNLADAPIYAANTEGVEWIQACELSDEPGQAGVYWAEPFTKEDCDHFAAEFLGHQGAEIDPGMTDISYYDTIAFYSDHHTYSLTVNYKDRSYEYTDYRVDGKLRFSETGGKITEEDLRAAVEQMGIEIPDAAEFSVLNQERGTYVFTADSVVEGDQLIDGELTCHVAEGGILYKVDNALSISDRYGDAAVISSQEAYERLCAGRFSWRDVPAFNYWAPKKVRVVSCTLGYLADSKGFRQPVYYFTLSDENDVKYRGGNTWTTFVPAL
ncbi:MAG: VanZ family protein [Dysosmobacter sp.]|uniref:VanZ family protein n=1 Tax=Dysosmobacter sp. TaxID=2591382 RepID=UPI003D9043AB